MKTTYYSFPFWFALKKLLVKENKGIEYWTIAML